MKKIPLTRGKFAIVDDEDYEELSKHKWHYADGYAKRTIYPAKITIYMHRLLAGAVDKQLVDHRNMDRLDNRRSNLRIATRAQNLANSKLPTTNTSGYRGVSWHRGSSKWCSQIRANGKDYWLGSFSNPRDAANVYAKAATHYFGEFARVSQ